MHHRSSRSQDHQQQVQQHEVLMLVLTKNPMMTQRVPADHQQGSN
jgi:hypothetical protein